MRKISSFLLLALLLASSPLFAFERQPNEAYRARRLALAGKMGNGVALLFAATESEGPNAIYGFRQDDYFYYLTGWTEPGAALLIAPAVAARDGRPARPYTEVLYLPAHNLSQERWTGPKLGAENPEAPRLTGFDRVEPLDRMAADLRQLLSPAGAVIFSDIPQQGGESPASRPLSWLRRDNAFPTYVSFVDAKPILDEMRKAKDGGEIALIRSAANASMAAHWAAFRAMRPGLTERYIAGLMTGRFEEQGCERPAYAPIVGSGFNGTVLHYSADDGPIRDGDLVVMDVAGEYGMYASDITRTVPADGHFTPRQREIYDIVLGAQRAAIAAFQSGRSTLAKEGPNSLYKVAYDYINTHGKDRHGQPLGQYFLHGLGHFVGLDVHDPGDTEKPLGPGMVFTIEPGIYLPEEKLGVRIEDIFYVDKDGKLVDLTEELPHSADEVEKAMSRQGASGQ